MGYGGGRKFYVKDRFESLQEDPKFPIDQPDGLVRDFPLKDPKAGVGPRTGKLTINDFPPEPKDVFRKMDQTMTVVYVDKENKEHRLKSTLIDGKMVGEKPDPSWTPQRKLLPLQFDVPQGAYDQDAPDQHAIYGRNTWMLWCGGNEDFWTYLAEEKYGILDFLKAVDSRKRASRLRDLGLVNQPGLVGTEVPGPYGLYLDRVKYRLGEEEDPADNEPPLYTQPKHERKDPNALEGDGVDPMVYGYPSGVLGLRLFPNPKFDEKAKAWWDAKAFYEDPVYASDPRTIRPFRVGMTCVICHIGPNPMNLPKDPEEPKWANLSSVIGNQYFRTSAAFATRLTPSSFLWHYVASQQPGTIDTSMVSTDSIDNFNSMNGIFELPARAARAGLNPTERMGRVQQTVTPDGEEFRHFPRVLMDGEDSIGLQGALLRVYLNIGLYHDEWKRCSNLLVGFGGNRPFSIDVMRRNSVYWRVNENFRIPYMASFFAWEKRDGNGERIQCATAAMHLKDVVAPDGKPFLQSGDPQLKPHQWEPSKAEKGGRVFTNHCMVCHSSKQPDGYQVEFSHAPPQSAKSWAEAPEADRLTLPFAFAEWENFKKSPSYKKYQERARQLVDNAATKEDEFQFFHFQNFLSTDLRIPVTLTQTNAARAMATNAIEGQVFDNFASETYKHDLPDVGDIEYYDPFDKQTKTWKTPGGGRGYYRVPTLVSIWATAPYLHDNALGLYIGDDAVTRRVSLEGRLAMFDDGMRKLLWKARRPLTPSGDSGLRKAGANWLPAGDPGWIFRTDVESEARFPRGHIRYLATGVLPGWIGRLALWLLDHPLVLPTLVLLLTLALYFFQRSAFFFVLGLTGVLLLLLFGLTGLCALVPWAVWLLLPLVLILGAVAQLVPRVRDYKEEIEKKGGHLSFRDSLICHGIVGARRAGEVALVLVLLGLYGGLWFGREFVNGHFGDLRLGPFPKGMPVSAVMNLDPAADTLDQLAAVRGLLKTFGKLRADDHKPIAQRMNEEQRRELFDKTAGPGLMRASKCPDWVLDRGHYFGEALSDDDKEALIAFLKTL
ncbi:MAG TPA: hypothetical protein VGO11_00280 [Chthoniobacteraceae bacterium]|nr:hypothetical protein [Chthoniobacteraceae bacterium]